MPKRNDVICELHGCMREKLVKSIRELQDKLAAAEEKIRESLYANNKG